MSALREHEVFNRFHLATLKAPPPPVDIRAVKRAGRDEFAAKIEKLFLDCDTPDSGHKAGWNAALVAVLGEIYRG